MKVKAEVDQLRNKQCYMNIVDRYDCLGVWTGSGSQDTVLYASTTDSAVLYFMQFETSDARKEFENIHSVLVVYERRGRP